MSAVIFSYSPSTSICLVHADSMSFQLPTLASEIHRFAARRMTMTYPGANEELDSSNCRRADANAEKLSGEDERRPSTVRHLQWHSPGTGPKAGSCFDSQRYIAQ
jgi:hypothetical protein